MKTMLIKTAMKNSIASTSIASIISMFIMLIADPLQTESKKLVEFWFTIWHYSPIR